MKNLDLSHSQDQDFGSTLRLLPFPDGESEEMPVSYPLEDSLSGTDPMSQTDPLEELLLSMQGAETAAASVVRRSVETNQRAFARCAILEQRASGILTVKGRSYDCQLVEMSIGGFGIIVPGIPKLPIGEDGKLRAPGLNYIVKITRQEIRPGCTFVGLRQVEEIVDRDPHLPNASPPVVGYVIAAVAGAMIATLMYYCKNGG